MSKKGRIGSLIALLIIAAGCSGQQQTADKYINFSPSPSGLVNVMTFNIRVDTIIDGFHRWNRRKDGVIDLLASNTPDVFGLQEALNSQVQDVQNALPQYDTYAVGRKDGFIDGESCPIFYRKNRFKLLDSGTFWFSDTPDVPGSKDWGSKWPRICSWVYLGEKGTDVRFYVYNVHMVCFGKNAHENSIQLLAQRVAQRKTQDPFIVMGDFNMKLTNPAMKYLLKQGYDTPYPKMADVWESIHSSPGPKFDHIAICENTKVVEASVDTREMDGRRPSDHSPLLATVFFEKAAA